MEVNNKKLSLISESIERLGINFRCTIWYI